MTDASQSERASVTPLQPGTAVAVTGATGFIGGRLVERLIEQGALVTCLVRNPAASARLHEMGAQTHLLNIAEPEPLHLALAGIDLVFHCAYDWENTNWNLSALRALIEACRANSRHHLVHVSSVVVYQKPAEGELTEKCAEDTSTAGYAHTKRELEHELFMAARDDGLSMTIIQPTIVYGPFSRAWTIGPAEMLRYGTVILPDHGEGICNAVYVDDVVSALIIAARHPRAIGQRFLISGPPITWRQFYEEIARAVGAKGPQYRPAKVIALRNHGKVGKLLSLVADPGWAIPLAAQKLVRVGLGMLPEGIRRRAENRLLGPITRRLGHVYLPSLGELTSLRSRATIGSAKARRELGYAPQFDFGKGMIPTARFLREVHLKAVARIGRLKQSACRWCYDDISIETLARQFADLGLKGMDLIEPDDWPVVKKYGLVPSMTTGAGTSRDALNRKENHDRLEKQFRETIPRAAANGVPNVNTFSGNRRGQSDAEGLENCVIGLKRVKAIAEDNNVTICLELLNSKVDHKDYQCDHTAWGVEVIKQVGSPRVKLLYDIYHMQIMEGDVIRTIRDNIQYIAHFHTGGVPGRHELDGTQELQWRSIAEAIVALGFQGYFAHEFIPTRDPMKSLGEAIELCDV